MHTYAVDRDLRAKVVVWIFIVSMLISLALNNFFSNTIRNIIMYLEQSSIKEFVELLEWLEVNPNFLGIPFWYAVITLIYDKWFWKFFIWWHQIPDLEGKWIGTLTSSYNKKSISMQMDIKQTWNKISFKSTFPDTKSSSYSNVAAIYVEGNKGIEIYFGFKNDSDNIDDDLPSYNGYNSLKLIEQNKIQARYFNERGNKGTFELLKVK